MNSNAFWRSRTLAATPDTPQDSQDSQEPSFIPGATTPDSSTFPGSEHEQAARSGAQHFTQIPNAAYKDTHLTDFEVRLLLELSGRIGAKASQRVRAETLAAEFERGLSTVRRALKNLESLGYIEAAITGRAKFYKLTELSRVSKTPKPLKNEHSETAQPLKNEHSECSKMSTLHIHNSLIDKKALHKEPETTAQEVSAHVVVANLNQEKKEKPSSSSSPSKSYLREAEELLSAIAETGEYVAVSAHPGSLEALALWERQGRTIHELAAKAELFKTRRGEKILNYAAFFAKHLSVILETQDTLSSDLQPKNQTPQATKTDWCGKCESDTWRYVELPQGSQPCSTCSPQAQAKRNPQKAASSAPFSRTKDTEEAFSSDLEKDSREEWDSDLMEIMSGIKAQMSS